MKTNAITTKAALILTLVTALTISRTAQADDPPQPPSPQLFEPKKIFWRGLNTNTAFQWFIEKFDGRCYLAVTHQGVWDARFHSGMVTLGCSAVHEEIGNLQIIGAALLQGSEEGQKTKPLGQGDIDGTLNLRKWGIPGVTRASFKVQGQGQEDHVTKKTVPVAHIISFTAFDLTPKIISWDRGYCFVQGHLRGYDLNVSGGAGAGCQLVGIRDAVDFRAVVQYQADANITPIGFVSRHEAVGNLQMVVDTSKPLGTIGRFLNL